MTALPSWIDLVGLMLKRLAFAAGVSVLCSAAFIVFVVACLEWNSWAVTRGWKE